MAGFMGTALALDWIWASGTIAMNTDYRTFNYTPAVQQIDDTAGADIAMSYVKGLSSGALSFTGKMQAGSVSAWGSAFKEGNIGTVIFYPEGTALGKYHGTVPAIVNAMVTDMSYNDTYTVSISWLQNGTRAEGTA